MSTDTIDLRSDTKTRPTAAMREAMRAAELGDAKAGEDPTVCRLETMAAERLGTEAAMLVISGTMANLIALMVHADPGDAFLVDPEAHIYYYEGAHTATAGLLPLLVPSRDGMIEPNDVRRTLRHFNRPARLLCLENTHNRAGGRVVPLSLHTALCSVAHEHGMAVHVDGARIFNAAVAAGVPVDEYGRQADSIMFCLSKSLGCPLGSVLCGSEKFIDKGKRARARLGGGMRQAGVIAAAGITALSEQIERLEDDHDLAKRLAQAFGCLAGLSVDPAKVETNMVNVDVTASGKSVDDWLRVFADHALLVGAHRPDRLRFVTHHHHDAGIIEEAVRRIHAAAHALLDTS